MIFDFEKVVRSNSKRFAMNQPKRTGPGAATHSGRIGTTFGPGIPQQQAQAEAGNRQQQGDGDYAGPVQWDDDALGGHADHR